MFKENMVKTLLKGCKSVMRGCNKGLELVKEESQGGTTPNFTQKTAIKIMCMWLSEYLMMMHYRKQTAANSA